TIFAQNNGGTTGWGVFFDLNVTSPTGVYITAFESNVATATPFSMDLYTCPTTYVGNDTNSAAWTLQRTAKGLGAGTNVPSVNTFAPPLYLPQASYVIAIYALNSGTYWYTNGTGSNQTYSNADLTISCGISRTALFGGGVNTPRVWNGTNVYDTTY